MSHKLKVFTIALLGLTTSGFALAQSANGNNGARVGKGGFMLNVIAFENCPSGDFIDSRRHQIAIQANYSGDAGNKLVKTNKIFLKTGTDFWVQDGNACDGGARFYLPISDANCGTCDVVAENVTFTEYEVRARVVGKPGGSVTVTSCTEVLVTDPITLVETYESLCSVGAENVWVGGRTVGNGKTQNKWENVSTELLTVCVDTTDDGACDTRVGLFDDFGEDYWWNWDTSGRPHVQLVFVPVN